MWWYASSADRDEQAFPNVGAKEGCSDMSVLEVEEGGRDRLKLGRWLGWEIEELWQDQLRRVEAADRMIHEPYSLIRNDSFAVAAFDREWFFTGV